ncbi:MAG: hypothetical protein JJU28_15610 [Cyclobacteriaceae bacterium]|nr:hypothetical protein [Cyclobacteriaceae bacterium]
MKKFITTTFCITIALMSGLPLLALQQSNIRKNKFSGQHFAAEAEHTIGMKTETNHRKTMETTAAERVTIMDQALNMSMATVNVPSGWKLHQDVASNPNGAGYLKFHISIESPEGEIYGYLPAMINYFVYNMYGQWTGTSFEQLVQYLAHYSGQPYLEKFSMGKIEPDHEAMQHEAVRQAAHQHQQMIQQSNAYGGGYSQAIADFGVYKLECKAFRKNVAYKGSISVMKLGTIDQSPQMQIYHGPIFGSYIFAPEKLIVKALAREDVLQIQINPAWDGKRSQIIDRETQRMSQDHQQRMAAQQQQFQSHQQNMAAQRQQFEQHNQDWYRRNFGSGGSGAYSGNAAVTDAITGYSSFNDPYTGHQIKQEGHYDYWYTNEFGEYHGTNDPNFQPERHYNGNWQAIQPLKPDH